MNQDSRSEQSSASMNQQREDSLKSCKISSPKLSIWIPVKAISFANQSGHWRKIARLKKNLKDAIKFHLNTQKKPELPLHIHFVRIAPRSLDIDNLATAMKVPIDTVSDWILPGKRPGFADSDPRFEFTWDQRKGKVREYALEISFIEK